MLAHLRAPPVGFEDAAAAHFTTQRDRILRQCWRWTLEAPAELREKMTATLALLHAALPPSPPREPAATSSGAEAEYETEPPLPFAIEPADVGDTDDELYGN